VFRLLDRRAFDWRQRRDRTQRERGRGQSRRTCEGPSRREVDIGTATAEACCRLPQSSNTTGALSALTTGSGYPCRRDFSGKRVRKCAIHRGSPSGTVLLGGEAGRGFLVWRMVLWPDAGEGPGLKNVFLRKRQFALSEYAFFCLSVAGEFVAPKICNQRTLLRRNHI
jgi:hypothetical protein